MILHLYGIFKICVEFIEAESRMVATGGWGGEEMWRCWSKRTKSQ